MAETYLLLLHPERLPFTRQQKLMSCKTCIPRNFCNVDLSTSLDTAGGSFIFFLLQTHCHHHHHHLHHHFQKRYGEIIGQTTAIKYSIFTPPPFVCFWNTVEDGIPSFALLDAILPFLSFLTIHGCFSCTCPLFPHNFRWSIFSFCHIN
jgi:hypothetical protein